MIDDRGYPDRQRLIHPPRSPWARFLAFLRSVPQWDPDPGLPIKRGSENDEKTK